MRFTTEMTDIAQLLFQKFVEGNDKNFLNAYLLGIVECDAIEEEQANALEDFIYAIFDYQPQK